MSEKILMGTPPRCGKTLKQQIEKILGNMHYTYYEDSNYKNFLKEINNRNVNCSDKAPHQEEINYLASLGLSYPVIAKILEQIYYSNIQEISK